MTAAELAEAQARNWSQAIAGHENGTCTARRPWRGDRRRRHPMPVLLQPGLKVTAWRPSGMPCSARAGRLARRDPGGCASQRAWPRGSCRSGTPRRPAPRLAAGSRGSTPVAPGTPPATGGPRATASAPAPPVMRTAPPCVSRHAVTCSQAARGSGGHDRPARRERQAAGRHDSGAGLASLQLPARRARQMVSAGRGRRESLRGPAAGWSHRTGPCRSAESWDACGHRSAGMAGPEGCGPGPSCVTASPPGTWSSTPGNGPGLGPMGPPASAASPGSGPSRDWLTFAPPPTASRSPVPGAGHEPAEGLRRRHGHPPGCRQRPVHPDTHRGGAPAVPVRGRYRDAGRQRGGPAVILAVTRPGGQHPGTGREPGGPRRRRGVLPERVPGGTEA